MRGSNGGGNSARRCHRRWRKEAAKREKRGREIQSDGTLLNGADDGKGAGDGREMERGRAAGMEGGGACGEGKLMGRERGDGV
ncbi:hypothetical protein LguiA_023737 [Lonicera macranthoides]